MPAAVAAAAAVGGAHGPQNVRDWDENDVHAWASEQRHFKPSLLAFLKSQEIHGEALLDPDLLADDDFRQQVSFGQRVALKKAVEALRERPSVKRELFAPAGSSPSREPPRSGLLAIGERPAAAAATALDGPADEGKRDDSPDDVGASGGSQDEPMTEVQSDSASEEEEPEDSIKSESESESDSDTNDFVEEEQLGLDGSSSDEGSDDIFGSDGSPSAASGSEHDEWTPAASHRRSRPRATRAAAAPRKQLHRIPRGAARTAAAGRSAVAVATTPPPQQKENASRSSAANSKKRGSGTLDAFLPLHAARAKRLQQHAAAAATAAAAPFARLAGARATAPAAVVPARAAAAAPAPAAAAAAPAAVNPASGSSSRSPSLVEKIKSRYEQIYADYADSLSGNAAPPSGANLANLSWMNIRYKVRAAVQVRVHKSLSFCAAFFAVSDAKPIMAKQAPGADTLTQVHSHNMCFVVFSLSA
jgi:hypothetical protein